LRVEENMKGARGTLGLARTGRPTSAAAASTLACSARSGISSSEGNGAILSSRRYALSTDGRNITAPFLRASAWTGRSPAQQGKSFLRAEDAREIENRFLKWVTPANQDTWTYNRHLLPSFKGMTGDANISFSMLKNPERLLASFLTNMTYPTELGHNVQLNLEHRKSFKSLHHWNDEKVFGLPPVAVVRLVANNTLRNREIVVAEVHWWRRTLRVIEMKKVLLREESGDEFLGELSEDDYELRKEVAEYPIPPRWLFEFKKFRWPTPPSPQELKFPELNPEEPPPEELLPYSKEPFPHPQHAMLGRPFIEEDDEQDLDDNTEKVDETPEQLVVGNFLVKPRYLTDDDETATMPS